MLFNKKEKAMAKKVFNIGFIGTGMISKAHMGNFSKHKNTKITWAADVVSKNLNAVCKEFNIPNKTKDYKEMLKDEDLDAVIVCTPPFLHTQMGIDVLKADKHLLMEKPISQNIQDAKKLFDEAKKHRKLVISCCSARHARLSPIFRYVKKFIDDGKLGKVYHIHHRCIGRQGRPGIEYHPAAKWFLNKKMAGGGPFFDWGVYDLSFHLGVVGDPKFKSCEAFAINGLDKVNPKTEIFDVEEHAATLMKFSNGMSYYWERSSNAHGEPCNATKIMGTEGGIEFSYATWDDDHSLKYFFIDKNGKGTPKEKTFKINMKSHKDDMLELCNAYVDALLEKGPVPMPFKTAYANLEIIDKVYKQAKW